MIWRIRPNGTFKHVENIWMLWEKNIVHFILYLFINPKSLERVATCLFILFWIPFLMLWSYVGVLKLFLESIIHTYIRRTNGKNNFYGWLLNVKEPKSKSWTHALSSKSHTFHHFPLNLVEILYNHASCTCLKCEPIYQ